MTLCNSGQASLGATRFKEQNVKTTCESSDDRPYLETMRCLQ